MNVVMLSRYQRNGASSRLRLLQYAGYLKQWGLASASEPFFDEAYLASRYAGRSDFAAAARAYSRRARQLRHVRHADLLWLEKEALPWVPWIMEQWLLPSEVPMVLDLDDAVFHQYDLHASTAIRLLLGRKLDRLMGSAALVMAGNQYLADRAVAAGAGHVVIVPTVVDLTVYERRRWQSAVTTPNIGWIGTPSTWAAYITSKLPLLVEVAAVAGARLLAVGAGSGVEGYDVLDSVSWTEDTEVSLIQQMDIGIMPLTDTPWARGKCGYKLIQYMACGLPVVASPVGVNAEIVEHGVNGFLATTDEEWRYALNTLLEDPGLRQKMGAAGRKKVEEKYSLQGWGPRVASLIRRVIDDQPKK